VVKNNKGKPELDARYRKLIQRIASNIQRIRKLKGYTQEDMMTLGFERRWFQRIESGKYSVSLPTIDRLARAFKVDVVEFFKP
jgi:transcriptional regulator with XRE-family HTH domain